MIALIHRGRKDEALATATIKPGHMVVVSGGAGGVKVHDQKGAKGSIFTEIQHYLGDGTDVAYASGDVVNLLHALPGDVFLARVPANCPAILMDDQLMSNGDGSFISCGPLSPGILYRSVAASTGVTNTVNTEQDFSLTYSIPANSLRIGDRITVRGHAVVSASAGADLLTAKVYIGSQLIATLTGIDAVTSDTVMFETVLTVRTIGAAGTFVAETNFIIGATGTATMKHSALAETALNTTTAKILKASGTWNALTATCTVALQSLSVDLERQGGGNAVLRALEALDNSAEATEAFIRGFYL
jgi:hypothetical protein